MENRAIIVDDEPATCELIVPRRRGKAAGLRGLRPALHGLPRCCVGSLVEKKAQEASDYGDRAQVRESRDEISRGFVEITDDERSEVGAEIADSVDQAHDGADRLCR